MGLPNVESVLERLTAMGCVHEKTRRVINHFSHNGGLNHDQLSAWGEKRNILTAWDGMEVEF